MNQSNAKAARLWLLGFASGVVLSVSVFLFHGYADAQAPRVQTVDWTLTAKMGRIYRLEDPEYKIVCYSNDETMGAMGAFFSCVKK